MLKGSVCQLGRKVTGLVVGDVRAVKLEEPGSAVGAAAPTVGLRSNLVRAGNGDEYGIWPRRFQCRALRGSAIRVKPLIHGIAEPIFSHPEPARVIAPFQRFDAQGRHGNSPPALRKVASHNNLWIQSPAKKRPRPRLAAVSRRFARYFNANWLPVAAEHFAAIWRASGPPGGAADRIVDEAGAA